MRPVGQRYGRRSAVAGQCSQIRDGASGARTDNGKASDAAVPAKALVRDIGEEVRLGLIICVWVANAAGERGGGGGAELRVALQQAARLAGWHILVDIIIIVGGRADKAELGRQKHKHTVGR